VDPSGYSFQSWLRVVFAAVAAVVVGIVAPEASPFVFAAIVGTAAVAGDQVGASIDQRQNSAPATPSPQIFPSLPPSPALGAGLGAALAGPPGLATAGGAPISAGARLGMGAATAGELAVPGVGEVLGAAIAGILFYQGAAALRHAYEEWDRGFEIEGYHATSQPSYAYNIYDEGFKLSYSDKSGTARFGPGFYLAATEQGAIAEYMKWHGGQRPPAVLKIRARLTRNLTVGWPLSERPVSRWIGGAMRGLKGSIIYGAFAPGAGGGINYVLFNPQGQVESARVESLGGR